MHPRKKTLLLQTLLCSTILLLSQKAYSQNANWIGTIDGDLNNTANWSTAMIPTQIGTFNSNSPPGVNLNPFTTSPLSIGSIHFPSSAAGFSFSFNNANTLTVTGAGITGTTNTNANIGSINALASTIGMPQILLNTGMNACSLGSALITLNNLGTINLETGAYPTATSAQMSLSDPNIGTTGSISANDLLSFTAINSGTISGRYQSAQMALIENNASFGNSSALSFTNTGSITVTTNVAVPSFRGFLGQFVIEDSSGTASFQAGDGTNFIFLNDTAGIIAPQALFGYFVSGQMGLISIAGGTNVLLGDQTNFNFTNNGSLSSNSRQSFQMGMNSSLGDSISFTTGDQAQFNFNNNGLISGGDSVGIGQLAFGFSANSGPMSFQTGDHSHFTFMNDAGGRIEHSGGFGIAGQFCSTGSNGTAGPYTFTVGDSASFDFTNRNLIQSGNNAVQMGFAGNAGNFSFNAGNNSTFTFTNLGMMTPGDWTLGQLVLDGSGSTASITVGNSPSFSFDNQGLIDGATMVGQFTLNGNGGVAFFESGNGGQFSFNNTGTILGNDLISGQLSCTAYGGLASCIIGNSSNVIIDNSGSIGDHSLNVAQIAIVSNNNEAEVTFGDDCQINVLNNMNGSISDDEWNAGQISIDGLFGNSSLNLGVNSIITTTNHGQIQGFNINHTGQFIIDGENGTATLSLGNGAAINILNEQTGNIEQIGGSGERIGQLLIDSDFGTDSLIAGDNCNINAINSGSIASTTPSSPCIVAQIYFDGSSGPLNIITGDNFQLTATNTATGTLIQPNPMTFLPAQIYFHTTVIPATTIKTVTAINQQPIPDIEGIVFDGDSNAATTKIVLENSSLVVNTTNPLTICSLTGDASSQGKLSQDLLFQTAGTTAYFGGTITGNGNLTNTDAGMQTLSGVQITAPQTVTQDGPGVLAFAGPNNSWAGDLIISEGTVRVLPSATFGTGTIQFVQTGLNPAILQFDAAATVSRLINITMNGGTLYAPAGQTITINGSMTGSSPFIKDGPGILNLATPMSVMYNGLITVEAGTLSINTSFPGDVNVNSGALLQGTGTIGGDVEILTGGIGSAGNSIGTLNVVGNYIFDPGSTYLVELDPTSSDLTIASGQLTISPNVYVQLSPFTGTYNPYKEYLIFESGAIDPSLNTFAGLINPYPLLQTELIYRYPNPVLFDIFLGITKLPFSALNFCLDKNAQAVANYLSNSPSGPSGGDFSDILQFLTFVSSCGELNADLLQLQPSLLKGLVLVQENNTMLMNQAVTLQQQSLYRSSCIRNAERKKWNIWADFWGDFMHQHKLQGEQGFHANTGGGLIGSNWQCIPNLNVGIAAGYSYSHVDWDHLTNSGSVEGIYGLLYASWFNSCFYVNGIATGAYNHYTEKRPIHLTSQGGAVQIHRHASSDFNGGEGGVSFDLGGLFNVSGVDISPFGAAEYYVLHQNSFKEHGADSLNLHVKASNADLLRASLGLNITRCYPWRNMKWIPTAQLAVIREQRFIASSYDAALQGNLAGSFTVYGMKPCRTLVAPLAGFTAWMNDDHLGLSLFYSGQFNGKYQDQQVNMQLEYCW